MSRLSAQPISDTQVTLIDLHAPKSIFSPGAQGSGVRVRVFEVWLSEMSVIARPLSVGWREARTLRPWSATLPGRNRSLRRPTCLSPNAPSGRTGAFEARFRNARTWRNLPRSAYARFLVFSARTGPIGKVSKGESRRRPNVSFTTALMFQAPPTASSAYILARQLGGDAPLMAGITASQILIGFAALPAVLGSVVTA